MLDSWRNALVMILESFRVHVTALDKPPPSLPHKKSKKANGGKDEKERKGTKKINFSSQYFLPP